MFLEISQNSQENTCDRISFLRDCNFIKKETLAQAFSCEFCEISKSIFFNKTHLVAAFVSESKYLTSQTRLDLLCQVQAAVFVFVHLLLTRILDPTGQQVLVLSQWFLFLSVMIKWKCFLKQWKRKSKLRKIVLLARSELNSNEKMVSKALLDSDRHKFRHNKLALSD